MQIILILILTTLFAAGAFAQAGNDGPAIQALVKRLVTAQTEYDQKSLDAILTSDYIEISPIGEFDPRDKVLGFYKPELRPDPTKVTASVDVTDHSIRTYGNFAIVIVKLNYSVTAEGKSLPPRSIRTTLVMRKEKGEWKIASAQYTGIRAAAPKPN